LREEDRDISERIALGQVEISSKDTLFDQRLYNKNSKVDMGLDSDDD